MEETKDNTASHEETEDIVEEVVEDVEQTVEDLVEPTDNKTVAQDDNEAITKLKEENEALKDRILRAQAEFENYKRRTEKTRISERKYQAQAIVTDLIPVLDNFDRALESDITEVNKGFLEGIQMVYNQFNGALEAAGVEKIATEGEAFDPNLHHAVMQTEESDVESNIIVEELQRGYVLQDRVIRPAMVKVNK